LGKKYTKVRIRESFSDSGPLKTVRNKEMVRNKEVRITEGHLTLWAWGKNSVPEN
jgi:hypothetical protein